jgi:hypothetical protein
MQVAIRHLAVVVDAQIDAMASTIAPADSAANVHCEIGRYLEPFVLARTRFDDAAVDGHLATRSVIPAADAGTTVVT